MTNMEVFVKTGPLNQALIQYTIDHPMHGRAEEQLQLSLRLGGILSRINLFRHSEQVDPQLEADTLALERDIAGFTQAE